MPLVNSWENFSTERLQLWRMISQLPKPSYHVDICSLSPRCTSFARMRSATLPAASRPVCSWWIFDIRVAIHSQSFPLVHVVPLPLFSCCSITGPVSDLTFTLLSLATFVPPKHVVWLSDRQGRAPRRRSWYAEQQVLRPCGAAFAGFPASFSAGVAKHLYLDANCLSPWFLASQFFSSRINLADMLISIKYWRVFSWGVIPACAHHSEDRMPSTLNPWPHHRVYPPEICQSEHLRVSCIRVPHAIVTWKEWYHCRRSSNNVWCYLRLPEFQFMYFRPLRSVPTPYLLPFWKS